VAAKGGRPPKYDPARMLPVVTAMAKLGATDMEVAQALKVSITTVELWARTHRPFLRALKPPKAVADDRVERSLFRRATGYTYDSEEVFTYDHVETVTRKAEDGKDEQVVTREKRVLRVPVVKHVEPNPVSIIFWLKNRRKDRWRDFKATELSTPPGRPLEVDARGPGEAELIGEYFERLRRASGEPAPGSASGADSGAHPGVGASGPEPEGQGSGKAPRKG
jgi:hypothetical protein